jgi:hypothetical protein
MTIGQVTIGSSGVTQVSTSNIFCAFLIIQNNASHTCRVGDKTVSSSKGIQLFATGSTTMQMGVQRGTCLSDYWIQGTVADVIDYMYEPL